MMGPMGSGYYDPSGGNYAGATDPSVLDWLAQQAGNVQFQGSYSSPNFNASYNGTPGAYANPQPNPAQGTSQRGMGQPYRPTSQSTGQRTKQLTLQDLIAGMNFLNSMNFTPGSR